MSCANGVPMTAHHGCSRKRSFGQHAPQSAPGSVTMPAAAGADRRKQQPRRPGQRRRGQVPDTQRPIATLPCDPSPEHSRTAPGISARRLSPHATGLVADTCRRIFDTELLDRAQAPRAGARAVPGADFLMRRAAEDLAERLATVGAALRQGGDAVLRHAGRARRRARRAARSTTVVRIEADAALLGGAAGIVAAPEHGAARARQASTSPSRCCRCRRPTTFPACWSRSAAR